MKSILTSFCLAGLLFSALPTLSAYADEAKVEASAPKVFSSAQKVGTKATCPVTGEHFAIGKDTLHAEHKGKHVYFCCPSCKKSFDKDPDKYTK